jgi:hypothetical protein
LLFSSRNCVFFFKKTGKESLKAKRRKEDDAAFNMSCEKIEKPLGQGLFLPFLLNFMFFHNVIDFSVKRLAIFEFFSQEST